MEREKTRGKGATCECEFLKKFSNLGLFECISSILEQKLECLNRTLTSLNSGFYSVTAHEYSFKTRAISKEKEAASSGEIAAEFHRPPPLIENPDHFSYSSS